jgi:23S rRNA maturation mini-RNase III
MPAFRSFRPHLPYVCAQHGMRSHLGTSATSCAPAQARRWPASSVARRARTTAADAGDAAGRPRVDAVPGEPGSSGGGAAHDFERRHHPVALAFLGDAVWEARRAARGPLLGERRARRALVRPPLPPRPAVRRLPVGAGCSGLLGAMNRRRRPPRDPTARAQLYVRRAALAPPKHHSRYLAAVRPRVTAEGQARAAGARRRPALAFRPPRGPDRRAGPNVWDRRRAPTRPPAHAAQRAPHRARAQAASHDWLLASGLLRAEEAALLAWAAAPRRGERFRGRFSRTASEAVYRRATALEALVRGGGRGPARAWSRVDRPPPGAALPAGAPLPTQRRRRQPDPQPAAPRPARPTPPPPPGPRAASPATPKPNSTPPNPTAPPTLPPHPTPPPPPRWATCTSQTRPACSCWSGALWTRPPRRRAAAAVPRATATAARGGTAAAAARAAEWMRRQPASPIRRCSAPVLLLHGCCFDPCWKKQGHQPPPARHTANVCHRLHPIHGSRALGFLHATSTSAVACVLNWKDEAFLSQRGARALLGALEGVNRSVDRTIPAAPALIVCCRM